MKNLFALVALVASFLTNNVVKSQTVSSNFASYHKDKEETNLKVDIQEVEPLVFKVMVTNPDKENFHIVLEGNNDLYFDEQNQGSSFVKMINMNNVEDGNYSFIVSSKHGKFTKNFKLASKTTRFSQL